MALNRHSLTLCQSILAEHQFGKTRLFPAPKLTNLYHPARRLKNSQQPDWGRARCFLTRFVADNVERSSDNCHRLLAGWNVAPDPKGDGRKLDENQGTSLRFEKLADQAHVRKQPHSYSVDQNNRRASSPPRPALQRLLLGPHKHSAVLALNEAAFAKKVVADRREDAMRHHVDQKRQVATLEGFQRVCPHPQCLGVRAPGGQWTAEPLATSCTIPSSCSLQGGARFSRDAAPQKPQASHEPAGEIRWHSSRGNPFLAPCPENFALLSCHGRRGREVLKPLVLRLEENEERHLSSNPNLQHQRCRPQREPRPATPRMRKRRMMHSDQDSKACCALRDSQASSAATKFTSPVPAMA
eukprot:CAMPEP_0180202568 /NCGR_PEP_ID=MMETSP0987-20121128/7375_1 /TAXON_ID=697907 /ORGANISM="non described non described, Strain CCMP2293" /LENGTH=354 /DNA_ID=CAMNT_0022157855 /DNA_START=757 /DNA_END=1820 /DNA_ORIENTATION=+